MKYRVEPACTVAAFYAMDIFGAKRVDAGTWLTPVYVNDVKPEEVEPATELLAAKGYKLVKD